jgi:hypothetical protein
MFPRRRRRIIEYLLMMMVMLPFGCKHTNEPEPPPNETVNITDLRTAFTYSVGEKRTYRLISFIGGSYDTTIINYNITACDTIGGKHRYLVDAPDSLYGEGYYEIVDSSSYVRDYGGFMSSVGDRRVHSQHDIANWTLRLLELPVQKGHKWVSSPVHDGFDTLMVISSDSTVIVGGTQYQHAIVINYDFMGDTWGGLIFVPGVGIVWEQHSDIDTESLRVLIDKNF